MTFLATSREFLRHDVPGHPETAKRLQAILDHAEGSRALRSFERLEPDRPATDDELRRTHTARVLLAIRDAERDGPSWLDPDTYVVAGSDRIARLAARLTIQSAVRALERDEGGLALVRPPGHHATADRSMGFCLYNNVAVAAHHVLATGLARRILIFDHDLHHGNGTQEIFYESDRVLYESFHLFPHYPGTGDVTETGSGAGEGYSINAPLRIGAGDQEVRSLLENVFVPAAQRFRPDLILVSAGFDSLAGDPLGGLELSPEFYGEIMHRLLSVTPRVVAVLEGGYQVDKIPLAVEHEARALAGDAYPTNGHMHEPPCLPLLLDRLGPK